MPPPHATSARPQATRHARRPESHRITRGIALGVTALLAFGVTGAATAYSRLQGNIKSEDLSGLMGGTAAPAKAADPSDPNAGKALNILLIGSDERTGENAALGGEVAGMRSDTTIVLHISADRKRVELVSIPRDTLVDIPACPRSDGTSSPAQKGQFNAAFSIGADSGKVSDAAACTMKTVEANTGISFADKYNYVVINFAGFVKMVDALGGVPICIPAEVDSPEANHLHLAAGQQTLNGANALGYARARKGTGLGDGSDTGRIVRQQQLLAAMVHQIQSKNMVKDAPALLRFLDAATSSVTASPDMASISNLTGLAYSLRGTLGGNITFMTIPFAAAPSDPNRVVMTSAADAIWANMAADKPLVTPATPAKTPPASTPPTGTATTQAPAAPAPTKTPSKGSISVGDVVTCG